MSWYTIRRIEEGAYRVVKFDGDFNVHRDPKVPGFSIYGLFRYTRSQPYICSCPAGEGGKCRHVKMIYLFLKLERVDTGWFYDPETESWERPLNHPSRLIYRLARGR